MNPTSAKTRLTQELALLAALREKSLASLRELQAEAEKKVVACNEYLEQARPHLEAWKEAGLPDDANLTKLARRYLKVLGKRQDAAMAAARAGELLEGHEEKAEGKPAAAGEEST